MPVISPLNHSNMQAALAMQNVWHQVCSARRLQVNVTTKN
eukprot:CAMPEP_0206136718 /NCGR_PEP_ID=MMETSP1473-20131121/1953_1 /ASSEMBLY_ACC=CAM_ASM_001109 /TAXON_ID=1461547 /ORGANISM="Stichococcus sp, Strain RCC1054" /LENGTH=39 /DNA_ID= /DNA_START= /DNA_END= /DNA_ORIENTATION=